MFKFFALLVLLVACMQSVTAVAVINRTPSKFERRQVNGVWRNLPRAGNVALPKRQGASMAAPAATDRAIPAEPAVPAVPGGGENGRAIPAEPAVPATPAVGAGAGAQATVTVTATA